MYSQPLPTFASWHKCYKSSNVTDGRGKANKKKFIPSFSFLSSKAIQTPWAVMNGQENFTKTEVDFEMSETQINWNKGDLDYSSAEV